MPIALDSTASCTDSLAVDKDKPEATRPAFVFRFLTRREATKLAAKIEEARATDDYEKGHALLDDALKIGVVGWKNIVKLDGTPATFGVDTYDEILTGRERWELAQLQITATQLAERDRPLSGSPSASVTGSSAKPAEPNGDASTSPAPSLP